MKCRIIIMFVFFACSIFAQETKILEVNFGASYSDENIILTDTSSYKNQNDSIEINSLKYYFSNVCLMQNGKAVWREKSSYHLIDISNPASCNLRLHIPIQIEFNEISFDVGIDSLTNEMGAMGGDLDPTRGMYWAWNSGYINFKLEGKSQKCKTRNNEFQFHIGGYLHPYNSIQSVQLQLPNTGVILIGMDVSKILSEINYVDENHVMSPSLSAVMISQRIAKAFTVK